MEPDQATSLQHELLKIKKGLKDWEYTFFKRHERKPTIKDIQDRPKVGKCPICNKIYTEPRRRSYPFILYI